MNELLTMHFGPNDVLVALSLDFDDHMPARDVEHTVSHIERKAAHSEVTRVFIEAQSFEARRRAQEETVEAGGPIAAPSS